ncbi:hypothetical protein TNCV_4553731 [Trichonephila clavipes]|nr:hypothetical protein TNCV_4553731 [Trichonephila clavipes]
MDDNDRSCVANIVKEYLQSEDIPRINWTAFTPDMNPEELDVQINAGIDEMMDMVTERERLVSLSHSRYLRVCTAGWSMSLQNDMENVKLGVGYGQEMLGCSS